MFVGMATGTAFAQGVIQFSELGVPEEIAEFNNCVDLGW
jgi:hypothetical protein